MMALQKKQSPSFYVQGLQSDAFFFNSHTVCFSDCLEYLSEFIKLCYPCHNKMKCCETAEFLNTEANLKFNLVHV